MLQRGINKAWWKGGTWEPEGSRIASVRGWMVMPLTDRIAGGADFGFLKISPKEARLLLLDPRSKYSKTHKSILLG